MDKFKWTTLFSVLLLITISIFFLVDKKKISSQNDNISELEDKIQTLKNKVSELEDDKKELEYKISKLTEHDNNFYQPNISVPNNQSFSSHIQSNDEKTLSGSGYAVVVYRRPSCDYFLLENSSGYIVAEWMGGNDPDVSDKITGNFNSFGTKDFYNQSRDIDCRLWVDSYNLSKESALEKLIDKCN